jgi:ribonuclease P protein component
MLAGNRRVNRRFRLTKSIDFKRVRRFGKSYAHPLIVLVAMPSTTGDLHIGVSAGRSVGNAVERNRAKRLLREAIRPLLPQIHPGWDIILLSRKTIASASFQSVQAAVFSLLQRAQLLRVENGR